MTRTPAKSPGKLLFTCIRHKPAVFSHTVTQSHKWNMANTDNINECMTNDSLSGKSSSGESLKFVKKLYIHGGNISNWNRIKRKTTPSSADEVSLIIDVSGNNITWLRKR